MVGDNNPFPRPSLCKHLCPYFSCLGGIQAAIDQREPIAILQQINVDVIQCKGHGQPEQIHPCCNLMQLSCFYWQIVLVALRTLLCPPGLSMNKTRWLTDLF